MASVVFGLFLSCSACALAVSALFASESPKSTTFGIRKPSTDTSAAGGGAGAPGGGGGGGSSVGHLLSMKTRVSQIEVACEAAGPAVVVTASPIAATQVRVDRSGPTNEALSMIFLPFARQLSADLLPLQMMRGPEHVKYFTFHGKIRNLSDAGTTCTCIRRELAPRRYSPKLAASLKGEARCSSECRSMTTWK